MMRACRETGMTLCEKDEEMKGQQGGYQFRAKKNGA